MTVPLQNSMYFTTPFSQWLREQEKLDSSKGFVTSDIDFIWSNHKTKKYIMLEEKCRMQNIKFCQRNILMNIHNMLKPDPNYYGFWFLQFEGESPMDGRIYLTEMETVTTTHITIKELTRFLETCKFDKVDDWFGEWMNN